MVDYIVDILNKEMKNKYEISGMTNHNTWY